MPHSEQVDTSTPAVEDLAHAIEAQVLSPQIQRIAAAFALRVLAAERDSLAAKVRELEKYARHAKGCKFSEDVRIDKYIWFGKPCTCGFAALAEAVPDAS